MVKKKDVFDLTMAEKFIELTKQVKSEPRTGDKYFDVHLTHISQQTAEIVYMSPEKFYDLSYEYDASLHLKANNPELDLSKMHPPLINITKKMGQGKGRATVAKAQKVKEIPVVVVAKKQSHIDAWKQKNALTKD